ncbi:KTSC domain-containing protein [Variibacter gotjawalensis]|nr:KTSC domain-containing protein [Variibacter gotjawalensis]
MRIDYDDLSGRLEVTFSHGGSYTYYMVPRNVYERFLSASSKGRFFNLNIRDQYSSR